MHHMIHGSCLCGGIRFEFTKSAGPFELCHCRRCRKVSGSAFFSGLYVRIEDFRLVEGRELITTYEAPICASRLPIAFRSAADAARRCRIRTRYRHNKELAVVRDWSKFPRAS